MKTIDQFMWGYQEHFRNNLESDACALFKEIGFDGEPEVLIVGLAKSDAAVKHQVCVEPENSNYGQRLFETLPDRVEAAINAHPMQQIFYTDIPTMREKPENIRRHAITEEIERHLLAEQKRNGVAGFCSKATPVGDYYVVVVIQFSEESYASLPRLKYRFLEHDVETNLLKLAVVELLANAQDELARREPEPGRGRSSMRRGAREQVARAAAMLMRAPLISGSEYGRDIFDVIDEVSKLVYEGSSSSGRIVLAAEDDPNVNYVVRLSTPVSMSQSRWLRKLVQMATHDTALIAGYDRVFGLGSLSNVSDEPFVIDLAGRHEWDLKRGKDTYMQVRQGRPRLPKRPFPSVRLRENMTRIFPRISEASIARAENIMDLLFELGRGSMIVFASDAAQEAERLALQGTKIQPTALTKELLERASAIDGSILADTDGICYAIGVILDGNASQQCTPGRGSRYNSAVRYVGDGTTRRMALVISDDRTVDVVPLLRPQVDRYQLESAVDRLHNCTIDNYNKILNFLDKHRFYLSSHQCTRVNSEVDRIIQEPRNPMRIVWVPDRFEPHPEMNDSFLKPVRTEYL